MKKSSLINLFLSLFLIFFKASFSQINITSLPYSSGVVNFNNFNPTSEPNTLLTIPAGWTFSCTGIPAYNGRSITGPATGGYWSYTYLLSGDYNLGAQRDAAAGDITYAVHYVNNTGGLITSLVLSWDYEQWRFVNTSGWSCFGTGALAGNSVLPTKSYIGANSSFLNAATATPVASFTLSGLSIANGASFGIAWKTNDDTGADNGVAIDNFSMSAHATPSITLANGTVSPGNIYQNSTNNVLYRTDVTVGVSPATLNNAAFSTVGSYASANLTNLKLWYSASSVFSSSTSTVLSTLTTNLGPGTKTFSGLSALFPLGTGYLFLTADLPCATTAGNVIHVNPVNTASFTFAAGTKSGSGFTAGGTKTISNISINPVSSQTVCSGKTVAVTFTTVPSGLNVSWNNNNTAVGIAASGTGNIATYTSPAVVSNQTGNLTATVSSGTCTGNAIAFSVLVKALNQGSTVWTGTASSNWSDSNNWSNCVCGPATDATIAAVTTGNFNPLIGTNANARNLTINSGATLSVQNNQTLHVYGNWINNGTFNAQKSAVVLLGSSAQTVGGSSTTSFYDVTLNNGSGASLSSAQQIRGNLLLTQGVLNTNNLLTLAANANESGRIGPINLNADIINRVNIEQYAPGGSTGWALLGSPISSGLTMTDWNDDFPITCLTCPNGYYNFPSIYTYKESIPGEYSDPNKYIPITAITNPIHNGTGYWVYLGNGQVNTTAIIFDVAGNVAKSTCISCTAAVTIPLSFTSNNGLANDGWNLISNPLPSPISWTALRNGNTNVDNAIYVYNADLNSGTGAYASFVNGVSSEINGGVNDNIAMCQGFYVHATAPATLTAGENVKTNTQPVFLKPANQVKPIIRLVLDGGTASFKDMTTFYFEQGGTTSFQPEYDAYKINYDETSYPYIGSMSDTVLTGINGLPELNSNLNILVRAITPVSGSFTFSSLQSDFPEGVCVTLYDAYTGITTNILTHDYVCNLFDTTSVSRFTMNFFTTTSPAITKIRQPVCAAPNSGVVSAKGTGSGPWNYEWKSGGTIVKTALNLMSGDSLVNLNGGNYSVQIRSAGGCDYSSATFSLDSMIVPHAAFMPGAVAMSFSASGKINFTNSSSNAEYNSWDFGDNSGISNSINPSHNYLSAGVYTITLICESSSFCSDTASETIKIVKGISGISTFSKNKNILLATISPGNYELLFSLDSPENAEITLLDIKGTLVKKILLDEVSTHRQLISLDSFSGGMYLLNVLTDKNTVTTFKLTK